jgi:hypothetical protein
MKKEKNTILTESYVFLFPSNTVYSDSKILDQPLPYLFLLNITLLIETGGNTFHFSGFHFHFCSFSQSFFKISLEQTNHKLACLSFLPLLLRKSTSLHYFQFAKPLLHRIRIKPNFALGSVAGFGPKNSNVPHSLDFLSFNSKI